MKETGWKASHKGFIFHRLFRMFYNGEETFNAAPFSLNCIFDVEHMDLTVVSFQNNSAEPIAPTFHSHN